MHGRAAQIYRRRHQDRRHERPVRASTPTSPARARSWAAQQGGRGLRQSTKSRQGRGRLRRPPEQAGRRLQHRAAVVRRRQGRRDRRRADLVGGARRQQITKDKNKVFLVSGAAASDLTGKACTPNTIHWTYDTWVLANGTGNAIVKTGGDSWFFLTADYAFGHALERDTAAVVVKNGGKVLGKVRHPFPGRTSRRSCCRRRRRRPRSSASPTPAATRPTRSSRRRSSASSRAGRTSPACWCSSPTSTRSACKTAQGLILTEGVVLGRQRRQPRLRQAVRRRQQGQSCRPWCRPASIRRVMHYLKAVHALKSDGDGAAVVAKMKEHADRRPAVRQGHDPRRRPQDPPTCISSR